jgi:uncharacterized protein (TIGR00369 family)
MPVLTASDLSDFLRREFPQAHPERFCIDDVRDRFVRFRYEANEGDLRPGSTVSGPTMMALADTGVYLAVLAMIGPVALAVTTSLNINFLRKPGTGELVVETTLLKLGKRLAVGEVTIWSAGTEEPVAHATVTYSIPPRE